MYLLVFYVPENSAEKVKQALFDAGAGQLNSYNCCSWQTLGMGQFLPLEGSNPTLGQQGQVETVSEYKIEMLCRKEYIHKIIKALKAAHPYEEVAYHYFEVNSE